MYTLAPDEKASTVMIYTPTSLVRGELVNKQNLRVSIWLRTQGVPNYIRVYKAQVLTFGGAAPRSASYEEFFQPLGQILGFHLAPPAVDPMDYDASEANRRMVEVNLLLGSFNLKAQVRISSQTDFATSIEVGRTAWMSIYEADITNPYLPQMPAMHVPMLLVRPEQVSFGV